MSEQGRHTMRYTSSSTSDTQNQISYAVIWPSSETLTFTKKIFESMVSNCFLINKGF